MPFKNLLAKPAPAHSQINWQHPLSRGLQACWLLGEGGGTKAYDCVGLYHGTITGTNADAWGGGRNGKALRLDGTNDYVDLGNVLGNDGKLTVSAWFCCRSFATGYQGVVIKGVQDTNYSLAINAGGTQWVWTQGFNSAGWNFDMGISLATDVWYHLVGVRDVDGQGGIIYINGIPRYSDAGLSQALNGEVLGIGIGGGQGFGFFNGLIEDVRIYNRALLPSEVLQLYMEPYSIFLPAGSRLLSRSAATGNPRFGELA